MAFKKREEMTAADKAYNLRMDPTVQREWIDACLKNMEKLNEWEQDFIRSVDVQWNRNQAFGYEFSEKQVAALEACYSKI